MVAKPDAPTRKSYTFAGWYANPDLSTLWNFATGTVSRSATLHARWISDTIPVYTVAFNSNGGSPVDTQVVAMGHVVARPPATTRKGMKFLGWHANADLTIPWNFHADVVTRDMTLYARWVNEATPIFTVTFDSRGGSLIDAREMVAGDVIIPPDDPTRLHYTFDGWFTDAQATTYRWNFAQRISGNITLYAGWVIKTYRVAFYTGEGADPVSPQTVEAGHTATRPPNPTKEGYTFAGWHANADLSVLWDFATSTVTADIVLYAKWISGAATIHTVTFNSNGGTPVGSQTIPHGGTAPRPDNPARKSYTFAGWYANPAFTAIWNFPTGKVTCDTTLYARWISDTIPTCTVAFNSNGGTPVDAQIVPLGGVPVRPDNPTKASYTFDGWYSISGEDTALWDFANAVAQNITLYAGWAETDVSTCTVVFNSNGGSDVEAQTVKVGGTAEYPENPTRMYHKFDGWFTDDKGLYRWNFTQKIYESMTLYAGWIFVPWTMDSIAINGAVQAVAGDTILYAMPCGDTAQAITVVYSDSAANLHRLVIPAPRPFNIDTAILQGKYILRLEKKFEFDNIVSVQLDGKLLMVLKNPAGNGGFNFQQASWWSSAGRGYEKLVGNKFYYNSPFAEPVTDTTLYVRLLDTANVEFKTCPYHPHALPGAAEAQRMAVYPNPVSSGKSIHLKEEFLINDNLEERYATLSLIDAQGKVVYVGKPSELRQGLTIPDIPSGLYHLVLDGKAGRKLFKIMVAN